MTTTDRPLTWRQRNALRAIREHTERHGYPPTMKQLGEAIGLSSVGSVSYVLRCLQDKGYITREPDKSRTIRLSEAPPPASDEGVRVDRADLRAVLDFAADIGAGNGLEGVADQWGRLWTAVIRRAG
jgi:SOS-response transcriptional repressor LexA